MPTDRFNLFARFVSSLTDKELTELSNLLSAERDKRILKDASNSNIPVSEKELASYRSSVGSERVAAIKSFRERTGMSLYASKKILDILIE